MIPLLVPDLPACDDIIPWLRKIDANRWYSNFGPLSDEFEQGIVRLIKQFRDQSIDQFSVQHDFSMVATCSGTTALEIGLSAYRFRPGTRVVLPSLTFPATATAVIRSGLIPVFADVDPITWVLTPETAADVVTRSGAQAVIPVASYGFKQDELLWQQFAKQHNCEVLIDAAGAFPAQAPHPHVNVCYSFHATKSLGIGEGGGLLSTNSNYLQTARELTNFGFGKGTVDTVGMNAKLSEYHAAVGLCQIQRFTETDRSRREKYRAMRDLLAPIDTHLVYQSDEPSGSPTLFVTAVPGNAQGVCAELQSQGVSTRQWYCPPLHLHPAFDSHIRTLSLKFGSLQVSEALADRLIGLPFHRLLSGDDIRYVRNRLTRILSQQVSSAAPKPSSGIAS